MATYAEYEIRADDPNLIPAFLENEEFSFNKIIPMPVGFDRESGANTECAITFFLTERLTKTAAETVFGPQPTCEVSIMAAGSPRPILVTICENHPDTKISFTIYYHGVVEYYENQNGAFALLSYC